MIKARCLLLLLGLIVAFSHYGMKATYAQEAPIETKQNPNWVTFGIGTGGEGSAVGMSFSGRKGSLLTSVRFIHTAHPLIHINLFGGVTPRTERLSDIALLFGN